MILREHEEPGYVVLDAAVRSFPPVTPLVIKWQFPLWTPCGELDPAALKGRLTKNEQRQGDRDAEGIRQITDAILKESATVREIRRRTGGMGKARAERLLDRMETDGRVTRNSVTRRGNETHEYQLTEDE